MAGSEPLEPNPIPRDRGHRRKVRCHTGPPGSTPSHHAVGRHGRGFLMRACLFLILGSLALGKGALGGDGAGRPGPVLVELFTSEGCSSCPPADALLMELETSHRVSGADLIVLSEHVDYWNRIGWVDPYSSGRFSQRQDLYAVRLGESGVYTPQMIVDGRQGLVGSDRAGALRAIAAAARQPKVQVTVALDGRPQPADGSLDLRVRVDPLPRLPAGESAELFLAVTESGLHSQVLRGENAGRRLAHTGVVRSLTTLGAADWKDGFTARPRLRIPPGWNRANLKAVVFVQERRSGRVLGAASTDLQPEGPS